VGGLLTLLLLAGCASVVWYLVANHGLSLQKPPVSGEDGAFEALGHRSAAWVARATADGSGDRQRRFDILLALALTGASAIIAPIVMSAPQTPRRGVGAALWSIALCLPLIWRRKAPVLTTFAIAVAAAGHVAAGYPILVPADLSILIALYTIARYGPRWAHRLALAFALFGSLVLALTVGASVGPEPGSYSFNSVGAVMNVLAPMAFGWVVCLAVWLLGLMRRARFETVAVLHERARVLQERAERLEIERDQQARIATAAERARIAREMHDIVAHSLSIMIVQADGGRYVVGTNPEAAGEALGTIGDTGRQALAEMRRLLGVLRSDDGGAAAPQLAPLGAGSADDVAGLQDLFDQAAASGMTLTVATRGEQRSLTPAAALTLHRICQEALTNVRKHAGPGAAVSVEVNWHPDAVELIVSDDGRGAGSDPSDPGFGLIGLRERAALVDGELAAGPRPGGGWQVSFRMPT